MGRAERTQLFFPSLALPPQTATRPLNMSFSKLSRKSKDLLYLHDIADKEEFMDKAKAALLEKLELHALTPALPYTRVKGMNLRFMIEETLKNEIVKTAHDKMSKFCADTPNKRIPLQRRLDGLDNLDSSEKQDPLIEGFPIVLPFSYHTNWPEAKEAIREIYRNDKMETALISGEEVETPVDTEVLWEQICLIDYLNVKKKREQTVSLEQVMRQFPYAELEAVFTSPVYDEATRSIAFNTKFARIMKERQWKDWYEEEEDKAKFTTRVIQRCIRDVEIQDRVLADCKIRTMHNLGITLRNKAEIIENTMRVAARATKGSPEVKKETKKRPKEPSEPVNPATRQPKKQALGDRTKKLRCLYCCKLGHRAADCRFLKGSELETKVLEICASRNDHDAKRAQIVALQAKARSSDSTRGSEATEGGNSDPKGSQGNHKKRGYNEGWKGGRKNGRNFKKRGRGAYAADVVEYVSPMEVEHEAQTASGSEKAADVWIVPAVNQACKPIPAKLDTGSTPGSLIGQKTCEIWKETGSLCRCCQILFPAHLQACTPLRGSGNWF